MSIPLPNSLSERVSFPDTKVSLSESNTYPSRVCARAQRAPERGLAETHLNSSYSHAPLPPVGPLLAPTPSRCIGGTGVGATLSRVRVHLPTATNGPLDEGLNDPNPDSARQGRQKSLSRTRTKDTARRLRALEAVVIFMPPTPRGGAGEISVTSIPSNRRPVRLFRPHFWVRGGV